MAKTLTTEELWYLCPDDVQVMIHDGFLCVPVRDISLHNYRDKAVLFKKGVIYDVVFWPRNTGIVAEVFPKGDLYSGCEVDADYFWTIFDGFDPGNDLIIGV